MLHQAGGRAGLPYVVRCGPATPECPRVLRPRVLTRAYDHTRRYCTGQEARLVNGDLLLWTQALFGNSDFQK